MRPVSIRGQRDGVVRPGRSEASRLEVEVRAEAGPFGCTPPASSGGKRKKRINLNGLFLTDLLCSGNLMRRDCWEDRGWKSAGNAGRLADVAWQSEYGHRDTAVGIWP